MHIRRRVDPRLAFDCRICFVLTHPTTRRWQSRSLQHRLSSSPLVAAPQPVSIAMTATILLTAAAAASLLTQSLPLQAASAFGDAARVAATLAEPAADTVYKVGTLVIEAPWARATPAAPGSAVPISK
jgi:hypothetical protein